MTHSEKIFALCCVKNSFSAEYLTATDILDNIEKRDEFEEVDYFLLTTGGLIQAYRKLRGYQQKDLAKIMSVTASNISQYERGEREATLQQLSKFSEALDIPFSFLLASKIRDLVRRGITFVTRPEDAFLQETAEEKLYEIAAEIDIALERRDGKPLLNGRCPICGNYPYSENTFDYKYCPYCGQKIKED